MLSAPGRRALSALPLLLLAGAPAFAQKYYAYLLDLGPNYVQIGWGTADGANTIGRSSPSHGEAIVRVAGRTVTSKLNYATFGNLQPDHEYTYQISIGQTQIASGQFRTWAAQATKLAFFVIGDYGTGNRTQFAVAQAMWNEFQRRASTDFPVRFILSTGDNIYGDLSSFLFGAGKTGAQDRDWAPKFFEPYQPLIARIPFFPSLGNHDGNETENRADLAAYLDNFAFPADKPGRYYRFNYGGLADFYALDSTRNTETGPPAPAYDESGPEFQWMKQQFSQRHAPWQIPFYHHPAFNAGPLHASGLRALQHWVTLFGASGVKVVFNGHEHNFQMSEVNQLSNGIRFITSGAGGELRPGNILLKMKSSNIAAWAPQNHFLAVEIEGKTMRVTPLSFEEVEVRDSDGHPLRTPLVVTLP